MKLTSVVGLIGCLALSLAASAQQSWTSVKGKIQSEWGEKLTPSQVLPEYPRPQLVRSEWVNLNGLWNYSIQPVGTAAQPAQFDGAILVPFAVESSLSGVQKTVGKDSVLWYQRNFMVPAQAKAKKILLHFGAVDWQCEVFVNDQLVGTHKGGFDPFSMDITAVVRKKGPQKLVVKVWDPSDEGPQPRGKQVVNPNGIWYTPVTGIWQTVWLEAVPATYISATRHTPDIDQQTITITAEVENAQPGDKVLVFVKNGTATIAQKEINAGEAAVLKLENPRLWSPENPFLYDLKISVIRNKKPVDEVASYFAMRKISMKKDANGIQRMLLNNEFLFQYGPLDQGWWPDGLYTAPSDEALQFDILKTREMGFNMIRKHVKVEPARWYYHCDQLGMLVWQDMPSGDMGNQWEMRPGIYGKATDKDRTPESAAIFKNEWKEIMQDFYNFPSIVVWVPFNEAWGQFKTAEIVKWTKQQDPTRLVNTASGGNFEPVGDIIDLHNYPEPLMPDPALFGADRILVLGEFGGLGLALENHTWQEKNNWGYQSFKNKEDLYKRYAEFISVIPHLIEKGLSAAVYTQTTDVEVETNGLMTYDRKVIKFSTDALKKLHQPLYNKALVRVQ